MRNILLSCLAIGVLWTAATPGYGQTEQPVPKWPEHIQLVLDNTKPLKFDRGRRLPLYLWPAMNPGRLDEATAEVLVRELDRRGIGLICSWRPNKREQCLTECLPVARAQKKCGLRIGNRVLVRRTDFTDQTEPVEIKIGDVTLIIPYEPGKCRIFSHE